MLTVAAKTKQNIFLLKLWLTFNLRQIKQKPKTPDDLYLYPITKPLLPFTLISLFLIRIRILCTKTFLFLQPLINNATLLYIYIYILICHVTFFLLCPILCFVLIDERKQQNRNFYGVAGFDPHKPIFQLQKYVQNQSIHTFEN